MFTISRGHSHFVFGVIQSGLTSFVATGIAGFQLSSGDHLLWNWFVSWLLSWVAMSPVVLAAPYILSLSIALTRGDTYVE
jgi:hypothetical protein